MSPTRILLIRSVAVSSLLCLPQASFAEGFLSASASCSGSSVTVAWTFFDDPENPVGHPEWVGYDILRRSPASCDAYVRLNDEPFLRRIGTHASSYTDVVPVASTLFEYRVIPVDADRNEVDLGSDCAFCDARAWSSCPELSAPLTHGTLMDWGWAFAVVPCQDACLASFYFDPIEELRPHLGTDTEVRFWGAPYCGTVEGCGMQVSRYEITPCAPVPARRASWGNVKSIYR